MFQLIYLDLNCRNNNQKINLIQLLMIKRKKFRKLSASEIKYLIKNKFNIKKITFNFKINIKIFNRINKNKKFQKKIYHH